METENVENNIRSATDESDEEIDLVELALFVLRKWRVLIALGVIGAILGGCFAMLKPQKTLEDFDLENIHTEEVEQYARYFQMYAKQLDWEEESVLLGMDPNEACSATKTYVLRVNEADLPVIGAMYRNILADNGTWLGLIEASGLDCSLRAIKQLASISFTKMEQEEEQAFGLAKQKRFAEVSIWAIAPSEEISQSMVAYLDTLVQEMNARISAEYEVASCQVMLESSEKGYSGYVNSARRESTELLAGYAETLSTLKAKLTEDDLDYYDELYPDGPVEKDVSWLKWAVVGCVLFVILGACVFLVLYLVDGSVKSERELLGYGLHPFAVIEAKKAKRKVHPVDKLLMPKMRYNDTGYLAQTLGLLKLEHVMLSGDMGDESVRSLLSVLKGEDGRLLTGTMLSVDASAQKTAVQSDGVVLVVHLWKTRRTDLEQELRICRKLGCPVLGTVMIG